MPRSRRLLPSSFRRIPPERRTLAARAAFWEQARTMTPYVAMERGDDVFLLPTLIDPRLFVNASRSDFTVLERAAAVLRDAGRLTGQETLIDIGAHIGTTTISALTGGSFLRAVSIEPDPDHLPLLRANVALNQLDERVTVIAAGVSDTQQQQHRFAQGSRKEDSYRWMKGRLVDETSAASVTVATVTLDGLAEEGVIDPATTGLLWFDCGRCEEQALQSAAVFLEHRVPLVFTLRQRQFTEPGNPLLARLRETYEHAVDLRSPSLADPVSEWAPTLRPIDDLATLPEGKKITDVLVF